MVDSQKCPAHAKSCFECGPLLDQFKKYVSSLKRHEQPSDKECLCVKLLEENKNLKRELQRLRYILIKEAFSLNIE